MSPENCHSSVNGVPCCEFVPRGDPEHPLLTRLHFCKKIYTRRPVSLGVHEGIPTVPNSRHFAVCERDLLAGGGTVPGLPCARTLSRCAKKKCTPFRFWEVDKAAAHTRGHERSESPACTPNHHLKLAVQHGHGLGQKNREKNVSFW